MGTNFPLWLEGLRRSIRLMREPPFGAKTGRDLSQPDCPKSAHSMFRCEMCTTIVPPRTPLHRLVTEVRKTRYPARSKANRVVQRNKNPKVKWQDDPGGTGLEIVREIGVCPQCALTHSPPVISQEYPKEKPAAPLKKQTKRARETKAFSWFA